MKRTDTVIIGGGQAGLAMSFCLAARGVDHVVVERGRVGARWRTERWDSLRLLTPRWQSRLPGWRYRGPDPDGFMTMPEVIAYLQGYADTLPTAVHEHTEVRSVTRDDGGYRVDTSRGAWRTANVVIATGHCDRPAVPAFASALAPELAQVVPTRYRNPGELPDGGVLVVGASASGVQLADEIHRAGRPVTLAVGGHTRLPRRYRGHDIMVWLEGIGALGETLDDVVDPARARRQPSLQLVGRPDHASLDLGILQAQGVQLVGRAVAADGARVRLAGDLDDTVARADAKLARLLARIDRFVDAHGLDVQPAEPIAPVAPAPAPAALDLRAEGIRTVVWATGFRRSYPWLHVPVVDDRGDIRQTGGVTPAPGLYALGLQFMRRRKSTFIDGVGDDARALADHICARLRHSVAAA